MNIESTYEKIMKDYKIKKSRCFFLGSIAAEEMLKASISKYGWTIEEFAAEDEKHQDTGNGQ